ncbi:retrovirus-related pol polyprotein from transposon TNT 1-94 [Tanacetum coccineum]
MNHQTLTVPQVIPQVAYQSPQAPTQLMTESPFVDLGFAILVFSPGDDLIACLNKAMVFLTDVASLRFPFTNNQLRTSSNPRNQATIQDGEGHMARQCTQPKRPRNPAWYKEKAVLAEAQEAGQILDEEQLAFLADQRIPAGQAQTIIPHNDAFQTEDLYTYDSDCDDLLTAQEVLMANISNYGSNIISEVPNSKTYLNDMDNQSVHALQDFEQSPVMDFTNNEISSDSNIIPYSQYLQETQRETVQDTNLQAQQDSIILSMIEQMSEQMINHVNNLEKANKEQNNETITAELERYKERVKKFEQRFNIDLSSREKMIDSQIDDMIREKLALKEQKAQRIKPNLYDGVVMSNTNVAMPVIDDEETLILKEESRLKMSEQAKDPKVIAKKISHKPIDYEKLNGQSKDFGKRFSPKQELSAEQAFWFHILNLTIEPPYTPPVIMDVPSELPKVSLVNTSLKKLKFHLTQFDSVVKKRTTPNALKEEFKSCEKCLNLDAELSKSKQAYNDFLKNYSQLEKHCISLEASMQLQQEVFQNNESCVNQNAVEIQEYFEINDLKARLQDKDKTICKLKDTIQSLRENTNEKNVNHDKCDLEPINKELENSVAKLLSENEHLCNEINHVKQVFKNQFDSIKQTRVRHKEQWKEIVENVVHTPSVTTVAPGMFKLDLVPLPPRLLKNRYAHIDYLRHTQEQANTIREIVEQAKAKQHLDSELDFACKYATRIQKLLVYVQDTYPNAITPSPKKVVITPMNKVKKVRFDEPLTSLSNIKQVESSNTSDSNTLMLSSIGVNCSPSNCGSNLPGNKRNDRISQTLCRNKKNKVEAQPRKVNKMNHVVKPVCDVDVKYLLSNANSKILCATCNKSMFDGVHDKCLLDLVQNGNKRTKSAKKHKEQNIWKPTGHVFAEVRFKWKPTGRTFTIVGNSCPLTRFISTNIVPPKQTTSHSDEIQKPEIKVDSRKPKNVKNICSSKIAKIVESKNANHSEPNQTWGSNATDIPSSSSLVMTGCPDCTLVSGLQMFETHDRESLSAHELCLGYNLFSVGQFCDTDLGVAFRKNICFIRNLEGVDLLSGSRDTNLYKISLDDMLKSYPICLLSKASKTKSWLWHRRLSHLNFGTLNKLAKDGLARGLPRLKFQKDHLCSAYNGTEFVNQTLREFYENVGISHQTSVARTPQQNGVVERRNQTLVEAARTMLIFSKALLFLWAEAINTACYTQNRSLIRHQCNKTPYELLQNKKPDLSFLYVFGSLCYPTNDHEDLGKFDAKADIGIFVVCALGKGNKSSHQPKAEDTNQEKLYLLHMDLCDPMHVASINEKEVARRMLIFSKAPLFLWAEAINTACYTQNRSLICHRYNKTPYDLMQDKKPNLSFFDVFGSLCYPTNDHEDLGKFDAKAGIGIFVGYAPAKKAFRIYNRRTRIISETIHVTFDELTSMAFEQFSLGPGLYYMIPATSSTGLDSNPVSQQPCLPPIRDDWDHLFQIMFDEYYNPPTIVVYPVQEVAAPRAEVLADSPMSTSVDQDAPSTTNLIGDPSHSVSTRKQLETDAMWCYFDAFLTSVEPKNFKQSMTEPSWIDAMQEEIHEFERLEV